MSRIEQLRQAQETDLFTYRPPPRSSKLMPEGVPLDVCVLFERLALQIIAKGFRYYSADAILHRIRWEEHIEKGNADFKANNNWTSQLARWFIANHPRHKDFFETRVLRSKAND
jgi:hypothetical protein